ncbi:MAG TPA: universal stress protein [Desulfosporosinus sp.]|nr:universal stress protein [Desulfosporosinus sp.]
MTDSTDFKVLLYTDGTYHPFSAAVYAANLFTSIPNLHLTILHVKESNEVVIETDYSRADTSPVNLTSEWMEHMINDPKSDAATRKRYNEIFTKTTDIFTERGTDVRHSVIYCNPSIPDTVEAILEYATVSSFHLIIMGTRGLTSLKGLIFGSLGYALLHKSPIPVLLVKKLSEDFIDSFLQNNDSPSFSSPPKPKTTKHHNIRFHKEG